LAYRIEFTPKADKQFRALEKSTQTRLARQINSLADNPRPHGAKKLAGEEGFYRVRAGDYRVVYQIRDKTLLVLIVRLGHRSEVYRRI
jgi:mRNA interferase RelE/StbE